jgi:hypothetical protein
MIMCGAAEITGYAFCDGISALKLFDEEDISNLQGLFRCFFFFSLIKGATYRLRYMADRRGNITMGALFDRYHAHKTTVQHDKTYALIGLSAHDPNTAALSVNYQTPWNSSLVSFNQNILFFPKAMFPYSISLQKSSMLVI